MFFNETKTTRFFLVSIMTSGCNIADFKISATNGGTAMAIAGQKFDGQILDVTYTEYDAAYSMSEQYNLNWEVLLIDRR